MLPDKSAFLTLVASNKNSRSCTRSQDRTNDVAKIYPYPAVHCNDFFCLGKVVAVLCCLRIL